MLIVPLTAFGAIAGMKAPATGTRTGSIRIGSASGPASADPANAGSERYN